MGREQMRAADGDRQQVADRLREALDEGRLDLNEYDERVQQTYAAKTYGELDVLLADLPGTPMVHPPTPPSRVPAAGSEHATREWLGKVWGAWIVTVAINVGIWAAISVFSVGLVYFWPVWVAVPWGLVLVVATIGGLASGAPRKMVAERQRKELEREHRQQRRALQARAIAAGDLPENPTKEQRRRFVDEAVARGDLPPRPPKP